MSTQRKSDQGQVLMINQLLETIRFEKDFFFLSEHLDRLEKSAAQLDFNCNRTRIYDQLQKKADHHSKRKDPNSVFIFRLLLSANGQIEMQIQKMHKPLAFAFYPHEFQKTLHGEIYPFAVRSSDPQLRYKKANRSYYERLIEEFDSLYKKREGKQGKVGDSREIILQNEKGELTETINGNLIVEDPQKKEQYLTPHQESGLLAGVFRNHLLKEQSIPIKETRVMPDHICGAGQRIFSVNSVRGFQRMYLAENKP